MPQFWFIGMLKAIPLVILVGLALEAMEDK